MSEYTEATYGERIANVYDEWYSGVDADEIGILLELAHGGKVLELGIGTGRVAIPLVNAGVSVQGIDASESMVARLHAKKSGENISVTMGNFADFSLEGQFSLIYVVFNTFFSLLTQDEQMCCFHAVARHLQLDGVFLIEAFVPDLARFTAGQAVRLARIEDREVQLDVSEINVAKQVISTHHLVLSEHGNQFYPVKIRYVWPGEMDLMAKLSHLQLRQRWSDWKKSEFSSQSGKHISVYGHE